MGYIHGFCLTNMLVYAIILAIMDDLTLQQQLFVKYYTTKGATFNNGTISYALAYDYELPKDDKEKIDYESKEANICASNGSRLLLNDKVSKAIERKMVEMLNDTAVDARLNEILQGGKDTDSIQAIKIHNELKQRITKKLDITSDGRPLSGVSDAELDKLANS